jgi:ubiquitin C-terminal hydrolase
MKLLTFPNLGNTCYINSVLQCFINDRSFKDKYFNNPLTENVEILQIIKQMVEYLHDDNPEDEIKYFNLKQFIRLIKVPYFKSYQQQDSHEFLMYFMDLFPIDEMYYGETKLSIVCKDCNNIKNVFEKFSTINLNVTTESDTLNNIFVDYLKNELSNDSKNLYYCEHCRKNTITDKKTFLWKLPKRLIITLKKYNQYGEKINSVIKIHNELLIRETFTSEVFKYSLSSVIYHVGDENFGHYYTAIKKNDKWIYIDDEGYSIKKSINKEDPNSYILFYSLTHLV